MSAKLLSASHARRCFAGIAALHDIVTRVPWHPAVTAMISSNAMSVRKDSVQIAGMFVHVNVATKRDALSVHFIILAKVAALCLIVSSVLTLTTFSGVIFARKNIVTTVD